MSGDSCDSPSNRSSLTGDMEALPSERGRPRPSSSNRSYLFLAGWKRRSGLPNSQPENGTYGWVLFDGGGRGRPRSDRRASVSPVKELLSGGAIHRSILPGIILAVRYGDRLVHPSS